MSDTIELYSVAFSDHSFIGIPVKDYPTEELAAEAAQKLKQTEFISASDAPRVTLVERIELQ